MNATWLGVGVDADHDEGVGQRAVGAHEQDVQAALGPVGRAAPGSASAGGSGVAVAPGARLSGGSVGSRLGNGWNDAPGSGVSSADPRSPVTVLSVS